MVRSPKERNKRAQKPPRTKAKGKDRADARLRDDVFSGDSMMAKVMREVNWSKTPLGPVETWPVALRMMTKFLLANRFPLLLWWGPDFCQLYNDAYRPILGTKHPQFVGRPVRECWNEIWHILEPLIRKPFEGGASTWMEDIPLEINRHGYLEETHFTIAYSPVPDDSAPNGIGGVLATVHEISEKVVSERRTRVLRDLGAGIPEERTAEEACARTAEVLAKYPKDVPFALLYLFDSAGEQAHLAGVAGASRGDAISRATIRIDDAGAAWPLAGIFAQNGIQVIEKPIKTASAAAGGWADPPSSVALVPIHANVGRPLAGCLVAGLSPRLRFDDSYQGFLELTASQIATAIANARAHEQERKRAESLAELDRAKTLFFSNISHELRTPLTLLLGPTEEALGSRERALKGDELEMVHRNELRLLKLVNTLLDFSRIEAGRVEAEYEPVELCKLTAEIASTFRSAMEKAGLRFTVECEPIQEPVYVDRDMWEKIVLNLLSNAFKFTFQGEVRLTLKATSGAAVLAVIDTGTGIPAGELHRAFERFHRIENTQARTQEGTGIGLALVQELVKLHSGNVRVESEVGKGSRFTVAIPLGKTHLPAAWVEAARGASPTAMRSEAYVNEAERWVPSAVWNQVEPRVVGPARAAGGRPSAIERELILIADDNADMRDYLRHLLQAEYRVHAAHNGPEAVEAAKKLRPALVLTDVMMPGLDGFGVLAALRKEAGLARTPVLLLSARAGEESRIEGLQAGADDYLVKPFTARELLARVAMHLRMAKVRQRAIEHERRLAAIVESSDDAIVSKDLNGVVTSWNQAAERMFGYTQAEMIGRPITTIIPPELQEDEPRILQTIARGERIEHFETVRVTKNGERIDVSLTISPIRDEAGKITGAAKIARDVTQRKMAEEALRTNEKLASVGRLATTVAHEINNPLEAVTNLVYLARHSRTTPQANAFLQQAEEELQRVSHLTKQTLNFYRDTQSPRQLDIGSLVPSVVSVFASRARSKAIEIVTEAGEAELFAVPGEMRQLIANLLSNSLDAVEHGGRVRIRVRGGRAAKMHAVEGVHITVADSGSGIQDAIRPKLFEPFFTTKKDVGTGLGLWVCKTIVEKHGGSIHVKSSAEKGKSWTAISVFLPQLTQSTSAERGLKQAV